LIFRQVPLVVCSELLLKSYLYTGVLVQSNYMFL